MSMLIRLGTLAALAISAPAGAALAQAVPPSDADQAAFQELQQTQQQLGQLQMQAISENATLEEQRASIDDLLLSTMTDIDPNTQGNIDRLDVLSQEAIAAQQSQDSAALDTLMTEAMSIRSELESAQTQALQREEVMNEIEQFEEDLMAAVLAIDPDAAALTERIEQLSQQLNLTGPGGG